MGELWRLRRHATGPADLFDGLCPATRLQRRLERCARRASRCILLSTKARPQSAGSGLPLGRFVVPCSHIRWRGIMSDSGTCQGGRGNTSELADIQTEGQVGVYRTCLGVCDPPPRRTIYLRSVLQKFPDCLQSPLPAYIPSMVTNCHALFPNLVP